MINFIRIPDVLNRLSLWWVDLLERLNCYTHHYYKYPYILR